MLRELVDFRFLEVPAQKVVKRQVIVSLQFSGRSPGPISQSSGLGPEILFAILRPARKSADPVDLLAAGRTELLEPCHQAFRGLILRLNLSFDFHEASIEQLQTPVWHHGSCILYAEPFRSDSS
jgi:hypothetical protein